MSTGTSYRLAGLAVIGALAFGAPGALGFTQEQLGNAGLDPEVAKEVERQLDEEHRSAFTYVDPEVAGIEGVVSWHTFSDLDYTYESPFPGATSYQRDFSDVLKSLDGEEIKLAGFIYPLEQAEKQSHFLISGFPPGCPFCLPAGPDQLVEVFMAEPVPYSDDPVILSGRFELLYDDPSGLMYRLHDARAVDV